MAAALGGEGDMGHRSGCPRPAGWEGSKSTGRRSLSGESDRFVTFGMFACCSCCGCGDRLSAPPLRPDRLRAYVFRRRTRRIRDHLRTL